MTGLADRGDLLRVERLSKSFGGLAVSRDVSLAMGPGDRVALIGPNGAGKTTLVNLVTGALSPNAGSVFLAGEDVTRLSVAKRVRRGLVRTFQVSRLFPDLTVFDHVALAVLRRSGRMGRLFSDVTAFADVEAEAVGLLAALNLSDVARREVREVAYGRQRLLEIALALALKPKVLILDEPAAGVSRDDSPRIVEALHGLPGDLAVLMIEHDMDLVFRFARRVVVLAAGQVIFEGDPAAVAADPQVRAAYLGSYAHARPGA